MSSNKPDPVARDPSGGRPSGTSVQSGPGLQTRMSRDPSVAAVAAPAPAPYVADPNEVDVDDSSFFRAPEPAPAPVPPPPQPKMGRDPSVYQAPPAPAPAPAPVVAPPEQAVPDVPDVVARALSGANTRRAHQNQNQMDKKPSLVSRPSLGRRQSTRRRSSVVQFRSIAEDVASDGSVFNIEERTINVEDSDREVSEFSVISTAAKSSTVPMAFDNLEFFQGEDGYRDVLANLEVRIQSLEKEGRKDWSQARTEIKAMGAFWRWFLQKFILWTNDDINRLRFTRGLQDWLPFQTIYESFLLSGVIRSWDQDQRSKDAGFLRLAFRNRNVSRAMVQNFNSTYDRLFHSSTQVSNNRMFDLLSQFPLLGFMSFAATENFPSTKNFAVRAIVRALGAEGYWITRFLTGNLQGLTVHAGEETPAQNLAAESTDFEQLNRDQYGTYIGREKTNAFRLEHRLPTDESIVRSFMSTPQTTLVNNGVEHVLRCLAKHWHNMLYQENGNFAHQRMEQMDPFTVLRFHMSFVLTTLMNLRGRNSFDKRKTGPFMRKLQAFNPAKAAAEYISGKLADEDDNDVEHGAQDLDAEQKTIHAACLAAKRLIKTLRNDILFSVCAGIPSRMIPFRDWLDAMKEALTEIEIEAQEVVKLVRSVDKGIKLGYRVLKVVNWEYETDANLEKAVLQHIRTPGKETANISSACIRRAMEILAPKDRRTLHELVMKNHTGSNPCQLLLGRTVTILKRELWRQALDDRIGGLSRGGPVQPDSLVRNKWYWVGQTDAESQEKTWRVCLFKQRSGASGRLRFVDVDINLPVTFEHGATEILVYTPIAEAISRAQKVFMTIELDHGKKFTYNAFMEFGDPKSETSLRTQLRRLATVSQLQCSELDKARVNTLTEIKKTAKIRRDIKPQNVIVVGGGPTGLLAAVHCIQSVLMSGGEVRIYEGRDTFDQEAAAFERAQIVRLDSRQMAMLRFHLGTKFEDIFVSMSGETDPHLGNTIPAQGFVEVTIKRLEYMIQEEVLNLYSRDLLRYYSNSKMYVDVEAGIVKKDGKALKDNDLLYLDGHEGTWKVKEFIFPEQLKKADLVVGAEYDILPRGDTAVRKFKLDEKDPELDHFHFVSQEKKIKDVAGKFGHLPPIYPGGHGSVDPTSIVFESITRAPQVPQQEIMAFADVKRKKYRLNVSDSHVIVAAGKTYDPPMKSSALVLGEKYDLISPEDGMPRRFKLEQKDTAKDFYQFVALESGIADISGSYWDLPPIFPSKNTHFHVTTEEPYAVCCIEGLKVSMGMHSLGQQRWGSGLADDIRSVKDQNTRIVGDFTKSVALVPIVDRMMRKLEKDKVWKTHFDHVPDEFDVGEVVSNVSGRILLDMSEMKKRGFRRVRLQTRFFELGMNYYLGMELSREFDKLKKDSAKQIVKDARRHAPEDVKVAVQRLRGAIMKSLDKLWYEAALEVIAEGDVYNPGGRASIPQLYTIDSPLEDSLRDLNVGEAFVFARRPWVVTGSDGVFTNARLESTQKQFPFPVDTPVTELKRNTKTTMKTLKMNDRFEPLASFEILFKSGGVSVVRNTAGYVVEMPGDVKVHRISDLSRGPNGYSESKVSLASFPVAHVVCHRAVKLNVRTPTSRDGYIMCYVGDGQASPHFMRYSGLTGACINCMSLNNMIAQAVAGVEYKARVQRYAQESNWSNGEVVQRGTGANYGEDGFLRPGSTYTHLIDYLYQKAQEYNETGTELAILSRDWKIKIAAALVPRGLENDVLFLSSMISELRRALTNKFEDCLRVENNIDELTAGDKMAISRDIDQYVNAFVGTPAELDTYSSKTSMFIKDTIDALAEAISYSVTLREENKRFSSEMFTQPKSVDCIYDDFAVEAQNFANSLTQSVAFTVAGVGLALFGDLGADIGSLIAGLFGIWFAFNTVTNVSRYKNRNEEARRYFAKYKMLKVQKAVFSMLRREQREMVPPYENPYAMDLDNKVQVFLQKAAYYGYTEAAVKPFREAYADLKNRVSDDGQAARFMRRIVEEYIPITFHVNSYLQEELVTIYKACDAIRKLGQSAGGQVTGGATESTLKMLATFKPKLEASLESETIKYGFFKQRKMSQWALIVTIRYFLSFIMPCLPSIGNDTKKIMKAMMAISPPSGTNHEFMRAQVDVRDLYYATNESQIASAVFLSGITVFFAGIAATVIRLISFGYDDDNNPGWLDALSEAVRWIVVLSLYGSFLAFFHFFRKIYHLSGLFSILGSQRGEIHGEIHHIRAVIFTQILLTFLRIVTNLVAMAALVWGLVDFYFEETRVDEDLNYPAALAGLAAILAILSVLFFFLVEFWVRYGLDPALGRRIFDLLEPKIIEIKKSMGKPTHSEIETFETLERETWEYTAKEFVHIYRFDTVFAADRFGSVLQYLQSQYLKKEQ